MIGFVTGMRAEARLLAGLGHPVACAGSSPAKAAAALVATGATRLVSFGIAGGLAPGLPPGTLVVATEVIDGEARFTCDPAWVTRAAQCLPDAVLAPVAGCDRVVSTTCDKAKLHAATQAVAVDMESHAVARVAERSRIPFLVVRAIADPARRSVPSAATHGLDAEGRPRPLRVAGRLLLSPGQIPGVLHLAFDLRAALARLRRSAVRIGT